MRERGLDPSWIIRTVENPEWSERNPSDPEVVRRFRALPEREGRIIRVACAETPHEIIIVSAFLDRGAETEMKPVVHYDAAANAAYIRFSSEDVLESEEVLMASPSSTTKAAALSEWKFWMHEKICHPPSSTTQPDGINTRQ
jgi:hypothetical protein